MDSKKIKDSIQNEIDASFLYGRIAASEKDEVIADYYKQMAAIENHHLQKMISSHGIDVSSDKLMPSFRARILDKIGKVFGYATISNMMMDIEKGISASVIQHKLKTGESLQGNETRHVSILKSLGQLSGDKLTRVEGRHRNVGGNALRAAVLGANDGLVSNMSLVMGVAGATNGESGVLVAGVAGLLAGAISMALGEWISVQSSKELYERQIKLELEEIQNTPEEEMYELELLYKAKGVPANEAKAMAKKIISDPQTAHEALIREELAINPEELKGSAWVAAITSFLLFSVGAVIPVLPFFWLSGIKAMAIGVTGSMIGLFIIGSAITLFTGKSIWFSGMRQVLFGLAAAAITFGIGKLIGVSLAG